MENDNYYTTNLESGKLNVFTSKSYYANLKPDQKKIFTHYCLWSNKQQCWISKGKAENCGYLKRQLQELQFIDKGSMGKPQSFKEQVEKEQQKATLTAERSDAFAAKAEQRSDDLYNRAKDMASVIPFGQPILVGHHSENRDRNYRSKIGRTFGKAFEEQDKATYYSGKAEDARHTAAGKKYSDPVYLSKRIKECQKNINLYQRRLKGKFYTYSPEKEISEKSKVFYNEKLKQEGDKLEYFNKCMKAVNPECIDMRNIPAKKNSNGKRI